MEEREALKRLKKQEEQALVWFIRQYSGYVNTVICNVLGPAPEADPVEDLISDVFLTLWEKAQDLRGETVKPWLAVVARNRAKNISSPGGGSCPWRKIWCWKPPMMWSRKLGCGSGIVG